MPTNTDFLELLFGDDSQWAHVTDFAHDPNQIPEDQHLIAWRGDYFSRYRFGHGTNQYFTISTFYADEKNHARRRKALYRGTHVIVLDDVKEKLSLEQVQRLPRPTYILETSPGSEQWGYKLAEVATDRHRVENLLDGLVANGLAPDGKDPGMKGVTRYVRLPDGYNTKQSKMVNGQPFKCQIIGWHPERTVTLDQLAAPFAVNLEAQRREGRVDGAAAVDDHPILQLDDLIRIKEVRSDGRYDITCPWVDEHTGAVDNGAVVFTNADGTIGFKCHHGACDGRNGADLLNHIEEEYPSFRKELSDWQIMRSFGEPTPAPAPQIDFSKPIDFSAPPAQPAAPVADPLTEHMGKLRTMNPSSDEARQLSGKLLQAAEKLPAIDKLHWQNEVRDIMHWTKSELNQIVKNLKDEWYADTKKDGGHFSEVMFVKDINQFYDPEKKIFYSPEAYTNSYSNYDPDVRKSALQNEMVTKVDRLDYLPKAPPVFQEHGVIFGNTWRSSAESLGERGSIDTWFSHFDILGWGQYRKLITQWMAYTIRYPEKKINYMILLGSPEGSGKDFLLYPLMHAMRDNGTTIDGDELLSQFHDYILGTKYLHINEAELGDRKEAKQVANKIKRLAAAPPDDIRVNQKGIKPMKVRNLLSVSMTTNSQLPLQISQATRRIFALWSDLSVRGEDDNMKEEWRVFWSAAWHWMKNGGAEAVIWYLRNEVDLSDFDPGTSPPVTDFLRDIRDASKSPMQQTIEAFTKARIGCFKADLLTAADMAETLRAGPLVAEALMYADPKLFTPTRVGCTLREMSGVSALRGRNKHHEMRLWSVRNHDRYVAMTPAELVVEYERQVQAARQEVGLRVVK